MIKEKIQPHCIVCKKPFKITDMVYTDTIFNQIQHIDCFIFQEKYIKEKDTYEDIVHKYPEYSKIFIVSDNPVVSLNFVKSYRK